MNTMRSFTRIKSLVRRSSGLTYQVRSISIGTNLLASSEVTLQKARPWYNSDTEGSNMAVDNAVSMQELFANKKVALFGVPAPFTGVCTLSHYPPYKALAQDFKQAGVDELVCYSVTDPYAQDGWATSMSNNPEEITFLADDDGSFAKAFGVDTNYDAASLGDRSIRFSMLVEDGIVKAFNEVEDASLDAEALLTAAK
jgi:peroxiredoxin